MSINTHLIIKKCSCCKKKIIRINSTTKKATCYECTANKWNKKKVML